MHSSKEDVSRIESMMRFCEQGERRVMACALGLALVALIVRLVFSFVVYPWLAGPLSLGLDPDWFGRLAMNWAAGNGFVFEVGYSPVLNRGPGYPFLLAGLARLFPDLLSAAVVTQCILGTMTCLVVFAIARRLSGVRVGWLAAGITAFHPLLIWYSPRFRYEPLLTLLLAYGIYMLLRLRDTRAPWAGAVAGLFFGAAVEVNQVILFLPITMIAVILLAEAARPYVEHVRRTPMLTCGLVLLVMALCMAPWAARNYRLTGQLIPVHSGGVSVFVQGNFEYLHYSEAPMRSVDLQRISLGYIVPLIDGADRGVELWPAETDQALLRHALAFIRYQPGTLLKKVVAQIPRFWYLSESPLKSYALAGVQGVMLVVAALGTFFSFRRRYSPDLLLILIPIGYFNLIYAITHVEARYSTPVIPYVGILAAIGVQGVVALIRSRGASAAGRPSQPHPEIDRSSV